MREYVITAINPKTGEFRPVMLSLTEFQLEQAKRFRLQLDDGMRSTLPPGFMPCDESFASP